MTPLIPFVGNDPRHQIFIKREDLSPTGSHKFRYLESLIRRLNEEGIKDIVLSTTGNAGISACFFAQGYGMRVWCLMSKYGELEKAAEIEQLGGIVLVSSRPVRFARYLSKKLNCPLLKASQDEEAVVAYRSLGEELIQQLPNAEAIVNFATSGTSSVGIMKAYQEQGKILPALHIVQAKGSYSIAQVFHPEQVPESADDAYGLADTPRREQLVELIKTSGGDAWYVTDSQIRQSQILLENNALKTSYEGAACFWTANQLKDRYQSIVVIFSGRQWNRKEPWKKNIVESLEDIDRLWETMHSQ